MEINRLRKKVDWLWVFFILTGLAIINLIMRSIILKPPIEFEQITFWPIVFYDRINLFSIFFLPFCLIGVTTVYLSRRQYGQMFLMVLATFLVGYYGFFSIAFDDSFDLLDSLTWEETRHYLGVTSDPDGWFYVAFCVGNNGKATCDYFMTIYEWPNPLALQRDSDSEEIVVNYEGKTLYSYSGQLPGSCSLSAAPLEFNGSCGK